MTTQELLSSIIATPDAPIKSISIMPAEECELVLHTFNATEVAPSGLFHPEQTLHGLLEHWAEATPNARACVFGVSPPLHEPVPQKHVCSAG